MAKITCSQCDYENEEERVYCHNCGVKLDRSLLPASDKPPVESPENARKRIHKLVTPPKIHWPTLIKRLVITLLWALLVAVLIQIARPPDAAPPVAADKQLSNAPFIAIELGQGLQAKQPLQYEYTEDQVNGYLHNAVGGKKSEGSSSGFVYFKRAFVRLHEGACTIGMDQRLFDYPIYATATYAVKIDGGKLIATNLGGALGRLPIHPQIMKGAGVLFQRLWDALKQERDVLAEMRSIEFHDKKVVIISQPKTAP